MVEINIRYSDDADLRDMVIRFPSGDRDDLVSEAVTVTSGERASGRQAQATARFKGDVDRDAPKDVEAKRKFSTEFKYGG